jgi:hypothetical protein
MTGEGRQVKAHDCRYNKRILWAAQDITRNRPALSRWYPDYKDEFAAFLKG